MSRALEMYLYKAMIAVAAAGFYTVRCEAPIVRTKRVIVRKGFAATLS